jgi:copper chaperone CopZ
MCTTTPDRSLQIAQTGGCACCAGEPALTSTTATSKESAMNTQTFPVTGMTCGHCVSAVTNELSELPGVTEVTVSLVAGGTSSVTVASDAPISEDQVASALDEAGAYQLASQ